jgi:hypothetical protein
MPKVTNAFTTYNARGNREDLSNAIYNIDPFDTPIMSMIKRRNVKNRIFDWQTEFLPLVDGNNAQIEGFVLANSAATPTSRLNNVTQISKRDASVSGSQEEVDAAGKGSEMAHQMAMVSKVLKNDMEFISCSRQGRVDGDDTTPTARKTESLPHWIARAVDKNAVTGTTVAGVVTGIPVAAGDAWAAVAGASQVSVTEVMMNDAMQAAYVNGASPTKWVVPPGPRRTISGFVGRSTSQVLVGKTEVVSTVDVLSTDFGRIQVMPSRWLPPDLGLLLDPDYAALAYFRAFRQYLLARTGDAETRMIVAEWGVECRNQLASIVFNGIKK